MSPLMDGAGLSLLGGLAFVIATPIVGLPVFFAALWAEGRLG